MPRTVMKTAAAVLWLSLSAPLVAVAQDAPPSQEPPASVQASQDMWAVEPTVHYPSAARYLGLEARISATVVVDSTGKPVKTYIVRREPVHVDAFDDVVRTALMKSRLRLPASAEAGRYYAFQAPFNFVLQGVGEGGPRPLHSEPPVMPVEALEQGIEGWVSVLVKVDASGRPEMTETRVLGRALPQFRPFDASALEAVGKYTFSPSRGQDRSESRWALVRVDFRLPQP